MMTLDHVGKQEAMAHPQLAQQPLARTTKTALELNPGTLFCLSARPPDLTPDLADAARTRPRVVAMFLSTLSMCPICILQARGGDAIPRLAL